jgi:crotonobetainyl-CoA:carnitine CoA-transferase CaiB-like acyl-CoA transferase
MWEREVMMEADTEGPGSKRMLVPGPSIIKFSKTPTTAGPIPTYGEHNQEIYEGILGLDADKLARLGEEGVI